MQSQKSIQRMTDENNEQEEKNQENRCDICFEQMTRENSCMINCTSGHVIHYECITFWVFKCKNQNLDTTCPKDRIVISRFIYKGAIRSFNGQQPQQISQFRRKKIQKRITELQIRGLEIEHKNLEKQKKKLNQRLQQIKQKQFLINQTIKSNKQKIRQIQHQEKKNMLSE